VKLVYQVLHLIINYKVIAQGSSYKPVITILQDEIIKKDNINSILKKIKDKLYDISLFPDSGVKYIFDMNTMLENTIINFKSSHNSKLLIFITGFFLTLIFITGLIKILIYKRW
jgi:hypothetical protein